MWGMADVIPEPDDCAVRFDGRVAVVTGAGRGLGREFALLLAARGARVVVNDIGLSADAARYSAADTAEHRLVARHVAEEITDGGGQAVANTSDVSDPAGGSGIINDALDAFGRVDIVINNAGVLPYAPFDELTFADMSKAFAVHVGGAFNVTRAAWPHLREQGYGRVINVASSVGIVYGNQNYAAYAAAKGALLGLTRVMAFEGAPLGIKANGLLPNAQTRGSSSVLAVQNAADEVIRSPALVAPAACWLAHEQCDATGEFFAVKAGGMRKIFISAAEGFQASAPARFSPEMIRDNWSQVCDRRPAISPTTEAEYNAFRNDQYRRVFVHDR
jgi:NAD(P)-dependent dehydrogenase (short-subunit alcohol dehydrogenase family)